MCPSRHTGNPIDLDWPPSRATKLATKPATYSTISTTLLDPEHGIGPPPRSHFSPPFRVCAPVSYCSSNAGNFFALAAARQHDTHHIATMTSAVAELEAGLQGMLNLKPPGVSGSRITALNELCVRNVQVRSIPCRRRTVRPSPSPSPSRPSRQYDASTDMTPLAVRIGSCPEALHPVQEGPGNTQTGRSLRRRLCNTEMDGHGQGRRPGHRPIRSRWNARRRCAQSD